MILTVPSISRMYDVCTFTCQMWIVFICLYALQQSALESVAKLSVFISLILLSGWIFSIQLFCLLMLYSSYPVHALECVRIHTTHTVLLDCFLALSELYSTYIQIYVYVAILYSRNTKYIDNILVPASVSLSVQISQCAYI